MLLLVFFLEYILVPVIYLWQFALVVYDTMGYISTVNQTAEVSIASSVRDIQNTVIHTSTGMECLVSVT